MVYSLSTVSTPSPLEQTIQAGSVWKSQLSSNTEAEFLDEKFSSLLFTVTFTALPWDLYLF